MLFVSCFAIVVGRSTSAYLLSFCCPVYCFTLRCRRWPISLDVDCASAWRFLCFCSFFTRKLTLFIACGFIQEAFITSAESLDVKVHGIHLLFLVAPVSPRRLFCSGPCSLAIIIARHHCCFAHALAICLAKNIYIYISIHIFIFMYVYMYIYAYI